ncbi:MAG: DinB family protein [Planctomycetota bacterium]|jgi:hypothetical protein
MAQSVIEIVTRQYSFHLDYARQLVADLDESQMQAVPGIGHENHPTFVLGHLCIASAMICEELGLEREQPAGWGELYDRAGPRDRRIPSIQADAPSKIELLDELARQHGRVEAALPRADFTALGVSTQWMLDQWMPTKLDAIVFLCTSHEAMHLGQLAAWRRAMGFPAAMAQMGRRDH